MTKLKGMLVTYTTLDGDTQKGLVVQAEQHVNFSKYKKVLIRLLNDEHNPKTDDQGKWLITLKHVKTLTHIGFLD